MKISTVVDLELLRRYAELGQWSTATDLYFNTSLDGLSHAAREDLEEAVWARDSAQIAEVVRKAAGSSRLLASHGKVKPLAAGTSHARERGQTSWPVPPRTTSS
jgi:hypothetical protein